MKLRHRLACTASLQAPPCRPDRATGPVRSLRALPAAAHRRSGVLAGGRGTARRRQSRHSCCAMRRRTTPPGSRPSTPPSGGCTSRPTSSATTCQGREFAAALSAAAKRGVKVRLIYDWLGALSATTWMFWERLRRAGVDVRAFNQPRLDSPLGWMSRDHRKMLASTAASASSPACASPTCGGARERNKGLDPWRDTGVAIWGPAVADIEQAFADVWAATGPPLPDEEVPADGTIAPAGTTALRVIGTKPSTAGLFRLDQLVCSVLGGQRIFIGNNNLIHRLQPRNSALGRDARRAVDRNRSSGGTSSRTRRAEADASTLTSAGPGRNFSPDPMQTWRSDKRTRAQTTARPHHTCGMRSINSAIRVQSSPRQPVEGQTLETLQVPFET